MVSGIKWRGIRSKEQGLGEESKLGTFEQVVLPHLDSAYNLARGLTRNDQDAEDVVQEAYLRALRFFDGFHGGDARAWLLAIVRNTCYTWLQKNRAQEPTTVFDEEIHSEEGSSLSPETLLLQSADSQLRSEEHTSELQSRLHLVCRLLLEKKKKQADYT